MANTFTMIGPSAVFPGAKQPVLPGYASVTAPAPVPVAQSVVPVKPLPGVPVGSLGFTSC